MKKMLLVMFSTATSPFLLSEDRSIMLCPIALLDETDPIHEHVLSPTISEKLEQITIEDTLITLSHIMQGVIALSTKPGTNPRLYMRVAAIIASLIEATSQTTAEHSLASTDSLARVYDYIQDTKRPRPTKDSEDLQERQRIRDIILASCINILTNVAVITAHPHDHKLVASQSTLIAANIINAVKETVRSPETTTAVPA
jgi:hypothetical protein